MGKVCLVLALGGLQRSQSSKLAGDSSAKLELLTG